MRLMTRLQQLNLIHFFDFYLLLLFLISLYVRLRQYSAVVGLVRAVPGRWPKLFQLVKEHRTVFMTWTTLLPAILALSLSLIHMLACRLVWPQANLTVERLMELWPAIPVVTVCGLAMLGVDLVATFWVGEVDRALLEKYFDQAEYWLHSWAAPVVRFFTLGRVNPRMIVAAEVQKALLEASQLLNSTLWWIAVQVSFRVAFGLSLWVTYAVSGER
jgi:hypothetical protein